MVKGVQTLLMQMAVHAAATGSMVDREVINDGSDIIRVYHRSMSDQCQGMYAN